MGNTVLLIVALALVSLWTGRLAHSKGRNPWLWGGASFALGIPTIHLLALVPLVVLMFIKSPQQQSGSIDRATSCSRCEAQSSGNSRFCIRCGWELSREFSADTDEEQHRAPVSLDTTDEGLVDAPNTGQQVPVQGSGDDFAAPPQESAPGVSQEVAPQAGQEAEQEPSQAEAKSSAPIYRKPVPVDAPTPEAMTERGVRLFNQDRIQESIDQFTKAIALDANYTEAWAKRAEAYARLGRGAEAAEDRRRLDSLDASSTGG